MCRKTHGTAFATYLGVSRSEFRWISGETSVQSYESSPGHPRPFCPRCGSVVAGPGLPGPLVFMPAGNLDGELRKELDAHTYVGSKAPWFEITDDLPQFDEMPT